MIPTRMENQMEKKMEMKWNLGEYRDLQIYACHLYTYYGNLTWVP